jgi:LacI family transcriptional regulator
VDSESELTAILAANDRRAAGALAAAHQYGIAIPRQLSVDGFDEDPLVSQVWRRLTTIMHQPIQAMAERAAGLLMRGLRRPVEQRTRQPAWHGELFIESSLIVRASTGPAREPGNP